MKKIVASLILFLLISQVVFADAKTEIEKVNRVKWIPDRNRFKLKKPDNTKVEKEKDTETNESNVSLPMTNLQYDEAYYHYQKVNKFIDDNLKYSQSGAMKY